MKREVASRIRTYIRNRRKRNRFLAVLSVLSFVVALSTFYALSMPALTLDNDAVGETVYGEEVPEMISGALPTPAATASAPQIDPPEMLPEMSDTPCVSEGPLVSASPAPESSPTDTDIPELIVSQSPLPSPSATPEVETCDASEGKQFVCEKDGLTVQVVLKDDSEIPDDAQLQVVRVTDKNSAANHTVNLGGIESELGVSSKSDFEYYLLSLIIDGKASAMPAEYKSISITDSRVGKKFRVLAAYGVLTNGDGASLFEIEHRSMTSENRSVSFSTEAAFTGLVMYWQKGTTLQGGGTQKTEPVSADTGYGEYEVKSVGAEQSEFSAGSKKTAGQTRFIFEENGLNVTADLSTPDAIPDGASLTARRITSSGNFLEYLGIYLRLYLNGYVKSGDDFYIYDIHFSVNGLEIEPSSGTVSVSVEDNDYSSTGTINTYNALHMDDSNNIQRLQVTQPNLHAKNKVKFSVNHFSTFIVLPVGSRLSFDLVEEAGDTFTHSSFYIPDRPLGMAGNFHIVAFDTATLSAHTNGNVLAQTCNAYSNFGTNNLPAEVSYIQEYAHVHPTSASSTSHILALGSSNVITLMDNGNAFGVNGTKLDKPYNILQDDDTSALQFVNLNLVESQLRSIALSYSGLSNTNINTSHLSTTGGSCDLSYIQLIDSDRVGVFNVTASQLNQYGYLGVKGFVSGDDGTVFINVDCTGFTGTVHIPNSEMSYNNAWLGFQERTTFIYGRILWNFINCTSDIETGRVYGSIVAPDASIRVYQNVNGSIIGKNVTINAESHRDDFVGVLTNNDAITVNKIWLDQDDSLLPASEVAGYSVTIQPYWSNNHGNTWHSNTADRFVLNSANNWTYSWNQPHNKTYLWRVEEIAVLDASGTDISGNYTASYSDNNTAGMTNGLIFVYNKVTYTLPDTGGITTRPLKITGILVMSIALYILFELKRRRKRQKYANSG